MGLAHRVTAETKYVMLRGAIQAWLIAFDFY
jgi:hypothetical protein